MTGRVSRARSVSVARVDRLFRLI